MSNPQSDVQATPHNQTNQKDMKYAFWTTLVTIAVAVGLMYFIYWDAKDHHVDVWFASIAGETNSVLNLSGLHDQAALTKRLQEQADFIGARVQFYKTTTSYFYGSYYTTIVLASIFGGLAALALALISLKGWKEVDPRLASVFFVTSAFAAIFWVCPKMLKQEENATGNKILYLKFVKLLEETRTIAATGGIMTSNQFEKLDLTNMVWHVHSGITNALDLAVAFDASIKADFTTVARKEGQ
jgi:hypothetical protein